MCKSLLIIGAGGHARVCADTASAMGEFDNIAFLGSDNIEESKLNGFLYYEGTYPDPARFNPKNWKLFLGIGKNCLRSNLQKSCKELGYDFATLVHPSSYVSPNAELGSGTLVNAGSVVQTGCQIGEGVIVNTRSSIDHDCQIKDFSSIAPGATLAGNVFVGNLTSIGVGVSILPNIDIGSNIIIGAGACVTKSLQESGIYIGIPARLKIQSKS